MLLSNILPNKGKTHGLREAGGLEPDSTLTLE
jgi:hypothetical protein